MKKKDDESRSAWAFFILLGIIIAIITVLLIFSKTATKDPVVEDSYQYNFFDFVEKDGVWMTQTREGENILQVALRNGPKDLEAVVVRGDISRFKENYDMVYVTFDPRKENHDGYVTMSNAEISPALRVQFGKDIGIGCIDISDECAKLDIPVINCENTKDGVIFLKREGGPGVDVNGNCVIIAGVGQDMVLAADRFMYGMYGIMK